MGRPANRKSGIVNHPLLFDPDDLPSFDTPELADFRSLRHPLWTANKAALIQEYIKLFTYVTKHGTYIDGFAAPQRRHLKELCSANLVLQNQPQWIRDLWLCDIDPKGIQLLKEIKADWSIPKRRITVLEGDFNRTVDEILGFGSIGEKTATFALLDQRTFECDWETVRKLAAHKKGNKIEIFYFLATGWLDRSIAAVSRPGTAERLDKWWGRSDWRDLRGRNAVARGLDLARRFRDELGYAYAHPYPIHDQVRGGRIMYHMVHATDHSAAPGLMQRAYRKISGRAIDDRELQVDLETLWGALRAETGEGDD